MVVKKSISSGTGEGRLFADLVMFSNDVVVTVYGGDLPHVGAIAVSIPRPSLANALVTSASTSVLTMTGHKEDEAAKTMAHQIASALNKKAVVTAGMHWDKADEALIQLVVDNCRDLTTKIIALAQEYSHGAGS